MFQVVTSQSGRPCPHSPELQHAYHRHHAFIPQADGARGAAFGVAAGVLFAVLAVLWLLAARGDSPEYRRPSRLFVAGTAACAVLLAGTALLPAGARVPAWGLLDVAYLAGYAAVVLCATLLLATSLPDWDRARGLYQPLARICAAVSAAFLALAMAPPAPLVFGLALVLLFSIPWIFAVTRRLASEDHPAVGLGRAADGRAPLQCPAGQDPEY